MLRLQSKITFTSKITGKVIVFDFVNEVTTSESYENLTQTAKITIPRKLNFDGKPIAVGLNSIFKRGDSVKIELGYYPKLRTVFVGYIARINSKTPITIECEDEMFILKQRVLKNKQWDKVSLKDALTYIIGDSIPYNRLLEIENLGSVIINNNPTTSKALEVLKSNFGLMAYFVSGVLNIGFASNATVTNRETFKFEETIIDESDLEYKRVEDIILKIKVISMDENNVKTEIEKGDENGDLKTFHVYKMSTDAMNKRADAELVSLKYEGYRGTMETFGEPYVRHGDNAILSSKKFTEKNGVYQIRSVNRSFGMNGYRQSIELGHKVG